MKLDSNSLNLLIAEDHQLFTDGLSSILQAEECIHTIHIARNGSEAVKKALEHDIDCLIIDFNLLASSGIEALKTLRAQKPELKIIVTSMLSDPLMVNKMWRAGADAFINKDTGKDGLLKAMEKVIKREKYIRPEISNKFNEHLTNVSSSAFHTRLTSREIEIIRHIAGGLTTHEIADKLFISFFTIKTHRKNILSKLHLKNTASLVKYAADHCLL